MIVLRLYRTIQNWYWARLRRIDIEVLWPQCKALAPNLDDARAVFAVHALNSSAWVRHYGWDLAKVIGDLE